MNLLPKEFLDLNVCPLFPNLYGISTGAAGWRDSRPGKRTVSAMSAWMGLQQEQHFQNYHRYSVVLYGQVVMPVGFIPAASGCLCTRWRWRMGIDDYPRDDGASGLRQEASTAIQYVPCDSHFVTSGLRWRSSDATGRHSLGTPSLGTPVFHRFGTSERHHQSHRHRHKTRLGTADAGSSATMVAAPSDCPGCR